METVNVAVRMERQTRDDAAKLFSELGISTTQAINMFLKQAMRERDPLRGNRKARRRARQREAWARKSGAFSPNRAKTPIQGSHLLFAEPVIPTSKTRRLGAWAPSVQEGAEARRMGPMCGKCQHSLVRSSHRMPAKETRGKTCGPIGCKEAVRAEIAPARRKAPREGNIVRAVPRACLGLARFILRPAPRLVRYARKEPPCCTNMLNMREYSACLYS